MLATSPTACAKCLPDLVCGLCSSPDVAQPSASSAWIAQTPWPKRLPLLHDPVSSTAAGHLYAQMHMSDPAQLLDAEHLLRLTRTCGRQ